MNHTANQAWYDRISSLLGSTAIVSAPRGLTIREQLHRTVEVNLTQALLTIPQRGLAYKFAAAEALWIMDADDQLASLLPYNKRMAEFSDDGVTLAGAYGPRLEGQIDYIVGALTKDRDTRQATAVIWRPNPKASKDIPCTVALTFMIRQDRLHLHVYMRSSDAWLGLPYDLFSFAVYAAHVRFLYEAEGNRPLGLGKLYLTAASSHLYQVNHPAASELVLRQVDEADLQGWTISCPALCATSQEEMRELLIEMRDGKWKP
jgi:thymidylate synthase